MYQAYYGLLPTPFVQAGIVQPMLQVQPETSESRLGSWTTNIANPK